MKLEEGRTQDFLIHAAFIGICGMGLIYLSVLNKYSEEPIYTTQELILAFIFGSIILASAITLARANSGIEIDIASGRIRVYKSIMGRSFGKWRALSETVSAQLKLTYESQDLMGRGGENAYTTKTYDLYLIDEKGRSTLLHEFSKQHTARETLKVLNDKFGIQIKDFTFIKNSVKRKR